MLWRQIKLSYFSEFKHLPKAVFCRGSNVYKKKVLKNFAKLWKHQHWSPNLVKLHAWALKYTKNWNPLQVFSCGFYSVFLSPVSLFLWAFYQNFTISRNIFVHSVIDLRILFRGHWKSKIAKNFWPPPPALFVFIHSSRNHSTLFAQTYDQHF